MSKDHEEPVEEGGDDDEVVESPDVHVVPIVKLQKIDLPSGEDDEETIFETRAKCFRWGTGNEGLQWKERGVGDLRLLKHKSSGLVRLLMRRDKTHKLCANHILSVEMKLEPNAGSDKAWAYPVLADYAEGDAARESLAFRFKDAQHANDFKKAFEAARDANIALKQKSDGVAQAAESLGTLSVSDDKKDDKKDEPKQDDKKEEEKKEEEKKEEKKEEKQEEKKE